jgi:hypothetical protein
LRGLGPLWFLAPACGAAPARPGQALGGRQNRLALVAATPKTGHGLLGQLSTKGHVDNPIPPLFHFAALGDEKNVRYAVTDRSSIIDDEDAGNMGPACQAAPDVTRHRAAVVGKQKPSVPVRPVQHPVITSGSEPNILDANQIQIALVAEQAPHEAAIEILVGEQPDHVSSRAAGV